MITWLKDISLDIPGKKKGRREEGSLVTWVKDISLDIPGKKKGTKRVPGYLVEGYKPGYTREEEGKKSPWLPG